MNIWWLRGAQFRSIIISNGPIQWSFRMVNWLVWEILFGATLKYREACDLGLINVFFTLLLFLASNYLFYSLELM